MYCELIPGLDHSSGRGTQANALPHLRPHLLFLSFYSLCFALLPVKAL